jgi:hypothetical protein
MLARQQQLAEVLLLHKSPTKLMNGLLLAALQKL